MRQRTDHRAELSFDQCWADRLGRLPDPVINLGGLQCIQNLKQCRLVQGHRVLSFREIHCRGLAAITRWPHLRTQACRQSRLLITTGGTPPN
jgi:hypothetical protein